MIGCGRVALPRTAGLLRRAQALLLALFPAADQKAEEQVLFHSDPELVLQHYGNAILRTAYTYLRNRSDAEDVVQDTLVHLLVADPGFESPAHEKAWLLRVTINRCKSFFRSAWQRKTTGLEDDFPDTPFTPDETAVVEAVNTPHPGKPLFVSCETHKGHGVSFMEDQVGWHGKAPNKEQYEQAMKELGVSDNG
mgnify:CR=1 FL=1